ncbi:hypothetical protein BDI4_970041 [Burkholderia diffusa]|nr:hypothetical protein BDI4_970041 [Burkholderia diffusa]
MRYLQKIEADPSNIRRPALLRCVLRKTLRSHRLRPVRRKHPRTAAAYCTATSMHTLSERKPYLHPLQETNHPRSIGDRGRTGVQQLQLALQRAPTLRLLRHPIATAESLPPPRHNGTRVPRLRETRQPNVLNMRKVSSGLFANRYWPTGLQKLQREYENGFFMPTLRQARPTPQFIVLSGLLSP